MINISETVKTKNYFVCARIHLRMLPMRKMFSFSFRKSFNRIDAKVGLLCIYESYHRIPTVKKFSLRLFSLANYCNDYINLCLNKNFSFGIFFPFPSLREF